MSQLFEVSYAILWIVVILQSVIIVSLMKQVSPPKRKHLPLQEHGLENKTQFPFKTLRSIDGETIALNRSDRAGTMVLVVSASCTVCNAVYSLVPSFQKRRPQFSVVFLMEGEEEEVRKKIEDHHIKFPVVTMDQVVKEELAIGLLPFAYLVSPSGEIVAKGGLTGRLDDFHVLTHS